MGAFLIGIVIALAQTYPGSVYQGLETVVAKKMAYQEEGTVTAWFRIVVSGMLGNGLIGMAAYFEKWRKPFSVNTFRFFSW